MSPGEQFLRAIAHQTRQSNPNVGAQLLQVADLISNMEATLQAQQEQINHQRYIMQGSIATEILAARLAGRDLGAAAGSGERTVKDEMEFAIRTAGDLIDALDVASKRPKLDVVRGLDGNLGNIILK
jgi:hypothetical protein